MLFGEVTKKELPNSQSRYQNSFNQLSSLHIKIKLQVILNSAYKSIAAQHGVLPTSPAAAVKRHLQRLGILLVAGSDAQLFGG